ncbi:Wzy polymerase domain-containing protein [Acidovorax sp. NCPPB 2350]|nr:Wzy polymerase domain-containing protein [Acidovorax sp. NCPPB 2350]
MVPESSSRSIPAAALVALVYALCWLLPNHHEPWTDFYSDAWAACVLWGFGAVMLWRIKKAQWVAWHVLPLLVLACCVLVWVQYAAGLVEAWGVAWTSSLYLMGLALTLLMGAALERWRPAQCADFLFMAALAGALGSLLIQFQQWLHIDPGSAFWLFIPAPPDRFHANLGQPNQLASLLCLGVLACAWFHQRGRLAGGVAWMLAVLLAVGLALAESRTTWLVVLLSLIMLALFRKRLAITRGVMFGAFTWAGMFATFLVALPYVNIWLGWATRLRPVRSISNLELRLDVWAHLWEAVLSRPWFGFGWMQTSFAQFTPNPYDMVTAGTHRHAHNLLMDLLVFVGIPLGLVLCAALVMWAIRALRCIKQPGHLWMLLFVAALGVHAMLEYPLYYAYFLLPCGLMVGALNEALRFRPVGQTGRLPVAGLMGLAGVGLVIMIHDYVRIEEDFFSLRFERQQLAAPSERLAPEVVSLTQLQDQMWLIRVDPGKAHSEPDIDRALRTTKLLPSTVTIYKLAAMYAVAGMQKQAEYWVVVMTRLNQPSKNLVDELHRQWNEQAEVYPEMAKVAWPK